MITDGVTFGWLCDVVVDEDHRGKGVGKALMTEVMKHDQIKDLKRLTLKTKDAHSFYEQFGFELEKGSSDSMIKSGSNI